MSATRAALIALLAGMIGVGAGTAATLLLIEKGPPGARGAQGPAGPVGPRGPAADTQLQSEVGDLESRISAAEADIKNVQDVIPPFYFGDNLEQLSNRLSDLEDKVQSICDSDPRI